MTTATRPATIGDLRRFGEAMRWEQGDDRAITA